MHKKNKKTKTARKVNPYVFPYMSFAIVCCTVLSVVFMCMNLYNEKKTYERNNQKKLFLMVEEMDHIISSVHELTLKMTINKHFQPFYFNVNDYYEIIMLEEMKNYIASFPELDEAFLCYGEPKIFHSSGFTMNINTYLSAWKDKEKETFLSYIFQEEGGIHFIATDNTLYINQPFELIGQENVREKPASLTVGVRFETLEERLDMASAGIIGKVAILYHEELLYANTEDVTFLTQKKVLVKQAENSSFYIYYLPDSTARMGTMFPLWMLLVISMVIVMLTLAGVYARRTYKPVENLALKFGEHIEIPEGIQFDDKLEEINYIMSATLANNEEKRIQLEQNQEKLRNQVLKMILSEHYFPDVYRYLDGLDIILPGPYYFVYSILFQEDVAGDELAEIKEQIALVSAPQENRYAYVVVSERLDMPILNIICSLSNIEEKDEFVEVLWETAGSVGYEMIGGCGSICDQLSFINGSYLESIDNIYKRGEDKAEYLNEQGELCHVYAFLRKGNEEEALTAFQFYVDSVVKGVQSFLAQKYIASNFLNEIVRIAREENIVLSNSDISFLVSAKNMEEFGSGGKVLIHNYCEYFNREREKRNSSMQQHICQYINEHFTEYDISIERIAEEMNTNTTFVRKAVKEQCGMAYKEYLIYLRMEHAKKLLFQEDMTVLEISQSVGYNTTSFFIKTFKEWTGLTPANYRNQYKK